RLALVVGRAADRSSWLCHILGTNEQLDCAGIFLSELADSCCSLLRLPTQDRSVDGAVSVSAVDSDDVVADPIGSASQLQHVCDRLVPFAVSDSLSPCWRGNR